MDEHPGIRTNTTICLGKIAPFLTPATRQKVLVSAFLRVGAAASLCCIHALQAILDPFTHAKMAGLMALVATQQFFSDRDSATRVIPAVAPLLLDSEPTVKEQGLRARQRHRMTCRMQCWL